MKTGIFIDEHRKAREVFESLGSVLEDQYGKIYYRMDLVLEQVGEETFIVHFDNDKDLPEYMVGVRAEFIKLRNFGKKKDDIDYSQIFKDPEQ